jgi:hypothetical protein
MSAVKQNSPVSSLHLVEDQRPAEDDELSIELRGIPGKQVRCRTGHHRFAMDDWEPGENIPVRGVSVMPASDGRFALLEPCLACWEVTRVTYTHPGGGIDGHLQSHIRYGKGWKKIPSHLPRGKRVLRSEKYRRGEHQLKALLGRVVTVDGNEVSAPPPVSAVKFQGA